ncbi:MAG TPA: hypothetical protein VF103_05770 [Polyangiaceae bacterium]
MKRLVLSPGSVRVALPLVYFTAVAGSGALFGIEIALLVAAGSALTLVVGFAWASVQSLTGDSPLTLDEALTLGQPSAEEEQKRAVLRALKDLEYERSVGKISEQDYNELSTRYREDAKRLIQRVDESLSPARERAEKLLAERVVRDAEETAKAKKKRKSEPPEDGEDDDAPVSEEPDRKHASDDSSSDEEERP